MPTLACGHCGSAKVQEARRKADAVTFRCLHCWKTFTLALTIRYVGATTRGDAQREPCHNAVRTTTTGPATSS